MSINQFPGAQLGQEPQMLQKMRAGDIDFVITSTANASTLAPQAGVFSLHFIFRDQQHLAKVLADPAIAAEFREMVKDQVQGAQVLGLLTMGMRNMYSKKEVKSVEDVKGQKVRVQATKTEDTLFPAYGAQTVHMPFGEVYTSLQTGVVNVAENGVNVYLANKHYEVAPILSMTEHEANNNCIWVSDKTWNSLTPEQQVWVQAAAAEVGEEGTGAGAATGKGLRGQAQDHRREGRRRRRQVRIHQGRASRSRTSWRRNSVRTPSSFSRSCAKFSSRAIVPGGRASPPPGAAVRTLTTTEGRDGRQSRADPAAPPPTEMEVARLDGSDPDGPVRRVHLHVHAGRCCATWSPARSARHGCGCSR